MTGKSAQEKLKEANRDCYLTRFSNKRDKHVLSVAKRGKDDTMFQHFAILVTTRHHRNEYEIDGAEKKFDDVAEMLLYYQEHHITSEIDRIGACYGLSKKSPLYPSSI